MTLYIILIPIIAVWGSVLAAFAHDLTGPLVRRVAVVVIYGVLGITAVGLLLALLRRMRFNRHQREAAAVG